MFADSAVALAVLVIILGVGKVLASQVVSSQESPTSNGIKPSFHHRLVNKYVGSYRVQRSRSVRGFSRASIPSRVSSTFLVRASNGVSSGLPWKNPFRGDDVEAWAVCLSKKVQHDSFFLLFGDRSCFFARAPDELLGLHSVAMP